MHDEDDPCGGLPPPNTAGLLARLLDLRADALRQLTEADVIDAGLLRIIADVYTVLAALDDTAAASGNVCPARRSPRPVRARESHPGLMRPAADATSSTASKINARPAGKGTENAV